MTHQKKQKSSKSKVRASCKETLEVLSNPLLMRQIRKSLAYFAKGKKGKTFEDVFGEPAAKFRRQVDALLTEDLGLLKRLAKA